jgi:hypothetical protein
VRHRAGVDESGRWHGGAGAPVRGRARRRPPTDVDLVLLAPAALSASARLRFAGKLPGREALGRVPGVGASRGANTPVP